MSKTIGQLSIIVISFLFMDIADSIVADLNCYDSVGQHTMQNDMT